LPKLHGLHHQHSHPIKGLLSLLLTHHFLVMDVDCCLTCVSVIPIIIWFIALALGLFKSPFHICVRHTNVLPHALSSALLLFHARPWKHLPQSRHSFFQGSHSFSFSRLIGGDTRRLTHGPRHTGCSLETHSFFSHHLGDTLLSLFVIYSQHTTSSLHGDTR